jgi:hypothetical protein
VTDEAKRTCGNCRFTVNEDFGYSNYTVEGTTFNCAKRLHPDGAFDRFYGEEPKLQYAEQCAGFEAGEPVAIDCECEDVDELSPEQRAIYDLHLAAS